MKKVLFAVFGLLFSIVLHAQSFPDSTLTGNFIGAGPDIYLNAGISGRLIAVGGTSYTWTPSTGLSDPTSCCPVVSVDDTTTYIVAINVGDTAIVYDTVVAFILEPFSTLATCTNLVTNGDFNTHTAPCNKTYWYTPPATQPAGYPFAMPNNWIVPTPTCTPDYFNSCSPVAPNGGYSSVNVPSNWEGYCNAHSANGYGGFIPYIGTYTSGADYSEYWQQNLGCTLLSGQKYQIKYWLALSANSGYACSDLGMYLSVNQITATTNTHLSATPQVTSGTVTIGTNTTTSTAGTTTVTNNISGLWGSVTGIFTGGGEKWITLGCFTASPSTAFIWNGHAWPYYYIDDVSITPLPPVITTTNVTACSGTSFQLCATGGANYTWSDIGGTVGTGSCVTITAPTVTATTVYSYTVTTTLTCPSTCNYQSVTSVTVYPAPTVSVNSASICPTASTTLTASGASTYSWSPGTGLSATTGSSVTASPSSTTIYTVNGSNSYGCIGAATSTVTVLPTPTVSVSNYTICSGSSATVTASGASTYTWNPGSLTGSSVVLSPTVTTSYTVTGTSSGGCISNPKTFTVTVNPKPTLSPVASPSVICSSVSTNTTSLSVSGASTYTWTTPGSTTVSCTACTSPTATLSGINTSFTFSVTGTSAASCTNSAVVTVTVSAIPTVTVNSPTICPGTATTLTASGASTYTWSANAGSATTSTVAVSPTVSTVYTVTGTASNGCSSSATSTITTKTAPTTPVFTGTLCAGITGTLSVSSGSGYTYTWTPSTGTNSVSCVNCQTVTVNNPSGNYVVAATNTTTGCVATSTYITNSLPNVAISYSPTNTYCANSPLTVTLTASGASTYTWSANAGSVTTSTVAVSPTVTSVYTVTGTSSAGCPSSNTSTITVLPSPATPVFTGTLCAGVTGTLSVSSGSGYTYTWTPSTGTNSVSCATCQTITVSNPSGSYIVAATNTTTGCVATNTYVTNALPTVSISSTPTSSYCASSPTTVTLTASGASTYTWSTSATTSSISVSPSSTTVYSVTGLSSTGCSNVASKTITVVPTPTITPNTSTNPVCVGATTTLSATGASSYTWNPGGLTGSSVTVNPTVQTTYTVTGAVSTCTASAMVTVSVTTTGTVSITSGLPTSCNYSGPGSGTICAGSSASFTASASALNSFTWTPGPLTGSVVSVTPTVTTTYTVTGSGTGCTGTNTITLNVSNCSCTGTALPALTTNTVISGGSYVLNSNTSVTANVTLSGVSLKIAANASITVQSGAILRLSGSHLSACYNMWQGIVVNPGGRVTIDGNSLIEDAKVAVDNNPSNTPQTASTATIQVNGAVFNCNNTAIRRAYHQNTTSSTYGLSYFKVNDAVITCRCSIPFPVSTSSLTVYSNTVTGTPNVNAPDLNDFYSVQNYTSANLKPPYFGAPAYEGVQLTNNGVLGSQSTTPREPYQNSVGDGTLVLFDNLTFGINALNSTLRDTGSAFQNPRVLGLGTKSSPFSGGFAINAINNNVDYYDGLYVNNSRFIGNVQAIHSVNYYDFDIQHNTIWGNVSHASGALPSPPIYGEEGIYISTSAFIGAQMNNNNMADLLNGIVFTIATPTAVVNGNGQYVASISTNNNTMGDVFSGNSYSNRLLGTAIAVSNALATNPTSTVSVAQGAGTFINARTNTITNAWNGIYMSNHQWQKVRDESNVITLAYQPPAPSEVTQYGIQHANCFYGTNFGDDIYDNTVTGCYASTYTFNSSNQSIFEKKKGIWSRYCGNHYVTCNDVYDAGRGFEFEGAHASPFYWARNTMNHSGEAFALTNSGVIGTQATGTTSANDNQWLSTSNTFAHTFTDASSSPVSSVLWLQGTSLPYVPTNNQTNGGTQYGAGTLVQSKPACTYSCTTVPPTSRIFNPLTGTQNTRSANNSPDSTDVSFYEDIVQDSIPYLAFPVQNSFINKEMVYRMIHNNISLADNSEILRNFYNNNLNSSWATFTTIEDSLGTSNYGFVSSLLNSFNPSFLIEQNYRRFYEIYISSVQGNISDKDLEDITILAKSCPMLNGTIVFRARALRNNLIQGFENYEDNCPSIGAMEKSTSISKIEKTNSLIVYPNPSGGKLYIGGFSVNEREACIEVADIAGRIVLKQTVSVVNGLTELSTHFNNGIYFFKITTNQGVNQIEKVIISK